MSFNFETFYLHNKLIWQNMFRSYQIQITCHTESCGSLHCILLNQNAFSVRLT